ncbi:hypothetical protein C8R43DRAFT_34874 [Mycena crocata]|nr:hypothetical protein C8R43DRAFT_34874 [Mycena crocata]
MKTGQLLPICDFIFDGVLTLSQTFSRWRPIPFGSRRRRAHINLLLEANTSHCIPNSWNSPLTRLRVLRCGTAKCAALCGGEINNYMYQLPVNRAKLPDILPLPHRNITCMYPICNPNNSSRIPRPASQGCCALRAPASPFKLRLTIGGRHPLEHKINNYNTQARLVAEGGEAARGNIGCSRAASPLPPAPSRVLSSCAVPVTY